MLKLLLFALGAYLLVVTAIFFAQTSLLFPTRMVGPAPPLPPRATGIEVTASTGERLSGVRLPARQAQQGPQPALLLVFPGNAWNAEDAAGLVASLFPDREVVAFHYRGYAPSEGRPSAAALAEDAERIHDVLTESGNRVVAIGFSVGSGVAARLASRRRLAGTILVTPFDSLSNVAAEHYRWLPAALLLRHRFDSVRDLQEAQVPVAIIAAGRDTLIPPARTRALAEAVPNLVFDRTISGAGHNDIYQHPKFAPAIREALQRVET